MKTKYIFFSIFILSLLGCKDFLVETPLVQVGVSNAFGNYKSADAYAKGVYNLNGDVTWYAAELSDICAGRGSWSISNDWSLIFNVTNVSRTAPSWDVFFRNINICNNVIDNVASVPDGTQADKDALLGEAYFWRAWYYYWMVRLWGDVPLRLHAPLNSEPDNVNLPRAKVSEVYVQILADFTKASVLCPLKWPSSDWGRPTKWSAKGYIAEANLTLGNWATARDVAKEVIDNSGMSLVIINVPSDYNKIYGTATTDGTNTEELLAIHVANNIPGYGLQLPMYYNSHITPANTEFCTQAQFGAIFGNLKSPINKAWKDADIRKKWGFTTNWVNPATGLTINLSPASVQSEGFAITKWRGQAAAWTDYGNDLQFMRLSDAYLIYAEAAAMANAGNPTPDAIEKLNVVRRRAYAKPLKAAAPGIDYVSGGVFRDTVLVERCYEFIGENHRFVDLKRTGQLAARIQEAWGVTLNPNRLLWPISTNETLVNKNCPQNPGYQ